MRAPRLFLELLAQDGIIEDQRLAGRPFHARRPRGQRLRRPVQGQRLARGLAAFRHEAIQDDHCPQRDAAEQRGDQHEREQQQLPERAHRGGGIRRPAPWLAAVRTSPRSECEFAAVIVTVDHLADQPLRPLEVHHPVALGAAHQFARRPCARRLRPARAGRCRRGCALMRCDVVVDRRLQLRAGAPA